MKRVQAAGQPMCLPCQGEWLAAVRHGPAQAPLGVLIVSGGPQVKVGAHRQFLQLSWALAAAGIPSLRFDVRGHGDSSGEDPGFEAISADIAAASAALDTARIVLWGLCDGASAALCYAGESGDSRVVGLALANPWVRDEHTAAQAELRHWYRRRVGQPDFWRKLWRGGIGLEQVRAAWATWRRSRQLAPPGSQHQHQHHHQPSDFRSRMRAALAATTVPVRVHLAGNDPTALEFETLSQADPDWSRALRRPGVVVRTLDGADHTFANATHRQALEAELVAFALSLMPRSS